MTILSALSADVGLTVEYSEAGFSNFEGGGWGRKGREGGVRKRRGFLMVCEKGKKHKKPDNYN